MQKILVKICVCAKKAVHLQADLCIDIKNNNFIV